MSFWGDIGGFFGGDAVGAAIGAGAIIGGALISSSANSRAADQAAEAQRERTAAIRAGNAQASQRLDELKAEAAPGATHLRSIVTGGTSLTPEQRAQLDEQRRVLPGTLARTGLRGSGRAITAAIKDVESDTLNRFNTANRSRQDQAAGSLAAPYFNATSQQASNDASSGRAVGEGLAGAGDAQAGATVASGRVAGQAIGDIASLINSERKRGSRYDGDVEKLRKALNDDDEEGI